MNGVFILVSLIIVSAVSPLQAATSGAHSLSLEVFTTTEAADDWQSAVANKNTGQFIDLQVYALDGIQRFEAELSDQLPADPKQAKSIALQRIEQLDEGTTAAVQQSAIGLAKAMQYGIKRYPAVVFNQTALVYGVTDLARAINLYQQWMEASPE